MIRVLLADNNVELCEILEAYMERHDDLEVVGKAYDGQQALERIAETRPDVVILDVTMPHLDGIAVMERLNEAPERPRVIVLTAFGREDIIQRFTDLGADYFIVKPFDLDILVERIRQFGRNRRPPVAERAGAAAPRPRPEAAITTLLHQLGVPPHFKGYTYLRDAVLAVMREDGVLGGALTKELYPRLAARYGASPGGVEAAIRNAVVTAWERGNREFFQELVGIKGSNRRRVPTNSLVIARLADKLRLELRSG